MSSWDSTIQLSVMESDGRPIVERPINISDLLESQARGMDVGNGVRVYLEEADDDDYDAEGFYDEELQGGGGRGGYHHGDTLHATGGGAGGGYVEGVHAPYGFGEVNEWYETIQAIEAESHRHQQRASSQEPAAASPGHHDGNVYDKQQSSPGKAPPAAAAAGKPPLGGGSQEDGRRAVWSAQAPPPLPIAHSYKKMRAISYMPDVRGKKFAPVAVMKHSLTAAAASSSSDPAQRMYLFGGTNGRNDESELYEFSLGTTTWRRVEGRMSVPFGVHSHAAVAYGNRFLVIGGVGAGGRPVDPAKLEEAAQQKRFKFLFPHGASSTSAARQLSLLDATRHGGDGGGLAGSAAAASSSIKKYGNRLPPAGSPTGLSRAAVQPVALGLHSLMFELELPTGRWRAVQTSFEHPIACHSAVTQGGSVYVFAGITERMCVTNALLQIDQATFAIRVLRTAVAPSPRYHHSAVVYGRFMVVHGGFDASNEPLGDTWSFDFETATWEKMQSDEVPRAGHGACVVGSRMLVSGGFQMALDSEGAAPLATLLELSLVPTANGFAWREVSVGPSPAPVAFHAACACGDGASIMLFAGMTVRPKKKRGASSHDKHRPLSAPAASSGNLRRSSSSSYGSMAQRLPESTPEDDEDADSPMRRNPVTDQGILLTFPVQQAKKEAEDGEEGGKPAVKLNHLGLAIDPTEQTPEFKAFVKRQDDFLKKKAIEINTTIKKTRLEEAEGSDVNLYLTPDEIVELLQVTDVACESLVSYDLKTLPGHIPERELKVFLVEDCVSLLRQARDVIKSMQTKPKENVVRSKTHRKKEGEKFEEHSAAKPFRQAVIMDLLKGTHLSQLRLIKMNKSLRTVEWPEKAPYIAFTKHISGTLRGVVEKIKSILGKYIAHRVETLMKHQEKHKDVIANLTKIVNKIQHDKVFKKDVVDPNREQRRKVLAEDARNNARGGSPDQEGKSSRGQSPKGGKKKKKRNASHSPAGHQRTASPGDGTDEARKKLMHIVVDVTKEDMRLLGKKAAAVQAAAKDLALYCVAGMWSQTQAVQQLPATGVDPVIASSDSARAAAAHFANDLAMTAFKFGNDCLQASLPPSAAATAAAAAAATVPVTTATTANGVMAATPLPPPPAGTMPLPPSVKAMSVVLHLSAVHPLLLLKKKMDEMAMSIARIRFNVWDKADLSGPKQDEKAESLYKDCQLKLLSLLQRVTSAFLTRAGAKPGKVLIVVPPPRPLLPPHASDKTTKASAQPGGARSGSPTHIFASTYQRHEVPQQQQQQQQALPTQGGAVVVGPGQPALQMGHMTLHRPVDPIVQVFPYALPPGVSAGVPITDTRPYLVVTQQPPPPPPQGNPARPEAILQLTPLPLPGSLNQQGLATVPPAALSTPAAAAAAAGAASLMTPAPSAAAIPPPVAGSIPDPVPPPTIPGSVVTPAPAPLPPAPPVPIAANTAVTAAAAAPVPTALPAMPQPLQPGPGVYAAIPAAGPVPAAAPAAPLPLAPASTAQAVPAALPGPIGQAQAVPPAALPLYPPAGPYSIPPAMPPSAAVPVAYGVPTAVYPPQGVGAPAPQTAVLLQQQQPQPQPGYPAAAAAGLPTTASVASSIGPVVLAARPRSAGAPLPMAPTAAVPGGIAQQQQQQQPGVPVGPAVGQPPIISGAFNGGMRSLGVHAPIDDYFLASRPPGLAPPATAASQPQASGAAAAAAAGKAGSGSVPHGQVPPSSSHDSKGGASTGAMFRGKLTKGEQAILKHREQNRHW